MISFENWCSRIWAIFYILIETKVKIFLGTCLSLIPIFFQTIFNFSNKIKNVSQRHL
eukprot:UN25699